MSSSRVMLKLPTLTFRHNPGQTKNKKVKKGNPNGTSHITMNKKVVHGLLIPLTHATSIHHKDVPLPKVIQDKDLT
jgi:hypothetical protein